ncbi:hypothetical protein DLAC_07066 [Tieghemostelium lacteum]|uniref:LIM zinc-binding domain-containing protein n=1 Tax=Tieghemostelium lacteum TaxID=361077 RepID=A0A151ZE82_TIELA|nr:hypothetical protein DLAC_07066 [Tieghemostelium lacteum]|eukprot:KYQ92220.1 hypothetical protein DLAC_07066 [Tieghemostelium lacteum]
MPPKFGGGIKCKKCGGSVYSAEQAPGAVPYHKMCFICTGCRKLLDSTNQCERQVDGNTELYCKACYNKVAGPKLFGYAGGGGTMGHTQ